MNRVTFAAMFCVMAFLAGCAEPARLAPRRGGMTQANGLELSLNLSSTAVRAGDELIVTVTARNASDKPITIHAPNSSAVWIRVWRNTPMGWDVVKTYPRAVARVEGVLKLAPGQQKQFAMTLPVEPDWPTNEKIRISGEINGSKLQVFADLLVERK